MSIKQKIRNLFCVAALGVCALSGARFYADFQKRDAYWEKRQQSELIEAVSQISPGEKFRQSQQALYDIAENNRPIPLELIAQIADSASITNEEATDYARAQKEFYKLFIENKDKFSLGQFGEDSSIKKMAEKYIRAVEPFRKRNPNIPEGIEIAATTYFIEGSPERGLPDRKVGEFTFEEPAYEFIIKFRSNKVCLPQRFRVARYSDSAQGNYFEIPSCLSPQELESLAKKIDRNGDRIISPEEVVRFARKNFAIH